MHDLGFITKIKGGVKGFKVMLGGVLGAQPRYADLFYEFLLSDKIIPLTEYVLRVFNPYDERKSKAKEKLKVLFQRL